MGRTSRQLIGMLGLLVGLVFYLGLVVTIATNWLPAHWALQAVFFAIAGVAWAVPLRPFVKWMNGITRKQP